MEGQIPESSGNVAAWLHGVGKDLQLGPSEIHKAGPGELLIQVQAAAVQPAEWKIQRGLLPIPLSYPNILGLIFSGIVVQVGPDVSRFSVGDRITTNSAQALRNDARFGAYQRYALTQAALTAHIGDYPFDLAATAASIYAPACALCYHLGLDRPAENPNPSNKNKTVLIWGASSTFGSMAVQIAAGGGYTVVGVASAHNESLVRSFGAAHFVDRHSATTVDTLSTLGPFQAVLMAQDSKADQILVARVLDAHGGGEFLSTMGVRDGVQLPEGVRGYFKQFLDEYLKPENQEFTKWLWWDYLETMLKERKLDLLPVKVLGGLDKVQVAWGILERGEVSATKLVIHPQDDLNSA